MEKQPFPSRHEYVFDVHQQMQTLSKINKYNHSEEAGLTLKNLVIAWMQMQYDG